MARTILTPTVALGSNAATGALFSPVAGDVANGNRFLSTGKELLKVHNHDSVSQTITVLSVADEQGRLGSILAAVLAPNAPSVLGPFPIHGWRQTDGYIYVDVSDVLVFVGVMTLP